MFEIKYTLISDLQWYKNTEKIVRKVTWFSWQG